VSVTPPSLHFVKKVSIDHYSEAGTGVETASKAGHSFPGRGLIKIGVRNFKLSSLNILKDCKSNFFFYRRIRKFLSIARR
jgi:hypothetical protein